ncbi:QacE family quaternary ammonium compound efflux SMR transporter [Pectobacterium carotovorum]|uniref:SMR family transporter n=1 Tax=Pectobacterium carotovorum TaxID=554 RepID=UPI0001A4290D|nr:SMR family transporter [Pectobacterium carotovorum]MDK9420259.1 SMR family transporter [Pectobacterium carotovorum]QHP53683.1 QacE family quaternary ammonium compound efflux SMR transporter [Pectobacterium carotovorum subsp. carotovorum]QLL92779.1 QacE family quaternary ammonium compound efflux SMR transporter [Pectobacterium carotovorum]
MNIYLILGAAIVTEVVATTLLKFSEGFTKLGFTLGALGLYGISFYMLSQILGQVPTGIAYAIWSGCGIVLISLVGWLLNGQKLDLPAVVGIAFICAGVIIINVLSKSAAH